MPSSVATPSWAPVVLTEAQGPDRRRKRLFISIVTGSTTHRAGLHVQLRAQQRRQQSKSISVQCTTGYLMPTGDQKPHHKSTKVTPFQRLKKQQLYGSGCRHVEVTPGWT